MQGVHAFEVKRLLQTDMGGQQGTEEFDLANLADLENHPAHDILDVKIGEQGNGSFHGLRVSTPIHSLCEV